MTRVETAIIGGGAIGLACAAALAKRGKQVVLLERGPLGGACSSGNAGLLVPSHVVPLAAPGVIGQGLKWLRDPRGPFGLRPRLSWELMRWVWQFRGHCNAGHVRESVPRLHDMLQESMRLFGELEREHDLEIRRRGMLMVFESDKGERECRALAGRVIACGMDARVLDRAALMALEPGFRGEARGAVHFVEDAHLDPEHLTRTLAGIARAHGAELLERTGVDRLEQQHGRITRVFAGERVLEPERVVLAGGAWSPELVRPLGLHLPVQAGKGYSVTLPATGQSLKTPVILAEHKVTITPLAGQLRFSGTLELSGLDERVNRTRALGILARIPAYLPDFDPGAVEDIWFGYRPCTPDGLPMIGFSTLENLVLATGHAMIGITLAPYTGQRVAELLT